MFVIALISFCFIEVSLCCDFIIARILCLVNSFFKFF
nr:MAG TPA: hypothetical protein [Caudoviricetes sp.]